MSIQRYLYAVRRPLVVVAGKRAALLLISLSAALLCFPAFAEGPAAFRFNGRHEVLGAITWYTVKDDDSLYEIARTYKTGFNEITAANPGVDPYIPGNGRLLTLPTSWILPAAPRSPGIVVDLSGMRLYYFFRKKGTLLVKTYPIGIGDDGSETPLGRFRVIEKIVDPAWYVPASIRKEKPELPAVVPPGPDNPMGSRALRLSRRTVLIHGTNMPWGIGGKISHGCIRLYPEDIIDLFGIVPLKTRVLIVRQPVKVGVSGGRIYLEVDKDPDLPSFDYQGESEHLLRKRGLIGMVSMKRITKAVREKRGLPVDISLGKAGGAGR